MGARTRRAQKTREAAEFAAKLRELQPPRVTPGAYAWELSTIVEARNAQMAGRFKQPARLAESMRTDDALYVAYTNRLDALASVDVEMVAAEGARGLSISNEGDALFGPAGIAISPDTARDFHGCLVNHFVSFAQAIPQPRADGTRTDYFMKAWPIEHVRWDAYQRSFVTQTEDGVEELITHGDGRWIVAQLGEVEPFKSGSILPAAMVWARHAFAAKDWAKGSVAHGNAKVIGKMPEGVALQSTDANGVTGLTAEAAAFLESLRAIASGDGVAGIIPAGATIEYLVNSSTAYQVWTELIANAEKAAARIYLGTDGVLGSAGGAPGVDITALFGVATTKIQGDRKAIEKAIQTGLIEPWAAVNFGSSVLAPSRRFVLPDADADAEHESRGTRQQAFYADIEAAKKAGADITQAFVDEAAKRHDAVTFVLKPPASPAAPAAVAPAALRSA